MSDLRLPTYGGYDVEKLAGEGGFGRVYKAHVAGDATQAVAIKTINLDRVPEEVHDIVREISVCSMVDHPNIVEYKETFLPENESAVALVAEWIEGPSLLTVLRTLCDNAATLGSIVPESSLQVVAVDTLHALWYLHRCGRFVHRDIKSANILVTTDGVCKLADLGTCAALQGTRDVRHSLIGTPGWIAPEVMSNITNRTQQHLDSSHTFAVDLWSWAVTMLELMCGSVPSTEQLMQYASASRSGADSTSASILSSHAASGYSLDFIQFVVSAIVVDPAKRPTAEQLLFGNDYMRTVLCNLFPTVYTKSEVGEAAQPQNERVRLGLLRRWRKSNLSDQVSARSKLKSLVGAILSSKKAEGTSRRDVFGTSEPTTTSEVTRSDLTLLGSKQWVLVPRTLNLLDGTDVERSGIPSLLAFCANGPQRALSRAMTARASVESGTLPLPSTWQSCGSHATPVVEPFGAVYQRRLIGSLRNAATQSRVRAGDPPCKVAHEVHNYDHTDTSVDSVDENMSGAFDSLQPSNIAITRRSDVPRSALGHLEECFERCEATVDNFSVSFLYSAICQASLDPAMSTILTANVEDEVGSLPSGKFERRFVEDRPVLRRRALPRRPLVDWIPNAEPITRTTEKFALSPSRSYKTDASEDSRIDPTHFLFDQWERCENRKRIARESGVSN